MARFFMVGLVLGLVVALAASEGPLDRTCEDGGMEDCLLLAEGAAQSVDMLQATLRLNRLQQDSKAEGSEEHEMKRRKKTENDVQRHVHAKGIEKYEMEKREKTRRIVMIDAARSLEAPTDGSQQEFARINQADTTTTPTPPGIPLPTCSSLGYKDIESFEDCQAAFDELQLTSKSNHDLEAFEEVSYSFYPKGCFSLCYSYYSGYFCRYHNSHATGNDLKYFDSWMEPHRLCKKSCEHYTCPAGYLPKLNAADIDGFSTDTCCTIDYSWVRLMKTENNTLPTCASSGYFDIIGNEECRFAFQQLSHPGKVSYSFEEVTHSSYSFYPRGCFSVCFSSYSGYTCRYFNDHSTGNPGFEFTASYASNAAILCRGTNTPTTTPMPSLLEAQEDPDLSERLDVTATPTPSILEVHLTSEQLDEIEGLQQQVEKEIQEELARQGAKM